MSERESSLKRPLRVLSFESRRRDEMHSLMTRHGAIATVAPSMREAALAENPLAIQFARELIAGNVDAVVFLTGVGARALLEAVAAHVDREEFLRALDRTTIIVRGPKPTAVLREWNVHIDHRAPEPNTWREVLAVIDGGVNVRDRVVAVQEYGKPNEDFYRELRLRGAKVLSIPVYRWAFPDDPQPLHDAVRAVTEGKFDVLLFTSAQQVANALQSADMQGLRDAWLDAARRCFIGSIGPTCSEALEDAGLRADVEASPPKMGQLVQQTLAAAAMVTR
jgi:uroporphyrinogen-III synthase